MFGKIFEQIYDSSIAEDCMVRLVFQDFIVLADINGVVDRTPEAISRRTNVPLETVKQAILTLERPDPTSRSPEENGARIRRLDEHREWGWEIINYKRYREIASDEQRRENTKLRTRKWRGGKNKGRCDALVTHGDAGDAMQRERKKERKKKMESTEGKDLFSIPSDDTVFKKRWSEEYLKVIGHKYAFQAGKDGMAVKTLLSTGLAPEELISLASKAWARVDLFNCKQASTISGFSSRFNQIRVELMPAKPAEAWDKTSEEPIRFKHL